ncbi:MAG: helix-turn-helix domain-containing protein [Bacteroidetes bacterium]|jgi:transcriptional regulator with XRE-family HTH domain|nr:helix-turn-helix domain-containing protein [Bacteroidota bacterium]
MSKKKSAPFLREIGSHIRNCREERRIPRKSFAHSLQISPQQLSNIENGNINDIGIVRIAEIAHILSIDFLEIVRMFKK